MKSRLIKIFITKYLIILFLLISNLKLLCLFLIDDRSSSAPGSFMFSLRNNDNIEPFNAPLRDQNDGNAIRIERLKGPIFGGGHDLEIGNDSVSSNTASFANFGYSYQIPPGYTFKQKKAQSLLAGSFRFRPSQVEVLYLN
jgi:hypothetical protein